MGIIAQRSAREPWSALGRRGGGGEVVERPVDPRRWLRAMVDPLDGDGRAAGTVSRPPHRAREAATAQRGRHAAAPEERLCGLLSPRESLW